jgi:hypothetical protein
MKELEQLKIETDYHKRDKLKQKVLGLYAKEFRKNNFKVEIINFYAFIIKLNDSQEIFVRPFDQKSYAQLDSINRDLYLDDLVRINIGFQAYKEPKKLYDDICKRIINTEFCINQWNKINLLSLEKNKDSQYKENKIAQYEKCFDFTIHDEKSKISFYNDGFSLDIKTSEYNEFTCYGLNDSQALEVIKLIAKFRGDK